MPASGSQILPVVVGTSRRALEVAAAMQAAGYDIRAIRPPTVPEGTARLRISVTLHVDEARIGAMFDELARALHRLPGSGEA
jgi:8-amino-7-oxononanoate synthase